VKTIITSIVAIFIFINSAELLYSQNDSINSFEKEFSHGTIFKMNRKGLVKADDITIKNDSILCINHYSGKLISIPLIDIEKINVQAGNKGLPYGIYGAVFGLLLYGATMATILSEDSDPHFEPPSLPYTFGIGSVAIGFGIGYLWGSLTPYEKTIYQNGNFIASYNNQNNQPFHPNYYLFTFKFDL
jgi:hypothetical protein